jgi:hypothetical protein
MSRTIQSQPSHTSAENPSPPAACCPVGVALVVAAGIGGGVLAVGLFVAGVWASAGASGDAPGQHVAAAQYRLQPAEELLPPARLPRDAGTPSTPAQSGVESTAAEPDEDAQPITGTRPATTPSNATESRFGAYEGAPPPEQPLLFIGVPPAPARPSSAPVARLPASDEAPRYERQSEGELRASLRSVAHVQPEALTLKALGIDPADDKFKLLAASDPQLLGLPFRMGNECRLAPSKAEALGELSASFRRLQPTLERLITVEKRRAELAAKRQQRPAPRRIFEGAPWTGREKVPGVEQMFQVEELPVRLEMVAILSDIVHADAGDVLARRALFDLSDEVRSAAIDALRTRLDGDGTATLLAGFRYPWPAAAWHAADAVVALDSQGLAGDLVELLKEPDPSAPFVNASGNWAVRELVAINHLRNCQLCHAPSTQTTDLVRGLVPVPGQALPPATQPYYSSQQPSQGNFVRADVTYLKQDFSAMQLVEDHGPWPAWQRFDYLVRERELTPLEIPLNEPGEATCEAASGASYPQREAVLYALRRLRGRDVGETFEAWDHEVNGTRVASSSSSSPGG